MSGCQDVTVTACNTCRCGAGVQEGGLASILLQTEQVPQVLALDPHDARHQEPAAGGPQHRQQQGPLQLQPHQGEGGALVIYQISIHLASMCLAISRNLYFDNNFNSPGVVHGV